MSLQVIFKSHCFKVFDKSILLQLLRGPSTAELFLSESLDGNMLKMKMAANERGNNSLSQVIDPSVCRIVADRIGYDQ